MIVLDCSAVVNIVRNTSEGESLRMLIRQDDDKISSELLFIETASVIRKYVLAGIYDAMEAPIYLKNAVNLVSQFVPIEENYLDAYYESLRLNHSVYDMLYYTLAQRYRATLVTLDKKLIQLCEQEAVDCIHIIDE